MVDINKQSFSRLVEDFMMIHKDVDHLEAIVAVCEKHDVDPRDCKRLLSKSIVEKLHVEVMDNNMIRGGNPSYILPI